MKEQDRLSLIIRFQIIEGPDQEGCDDGREQGGLQILSARTGSMTSSDHEAHKDKQHIQISIPLGQSLFIKLLRDFVISRPNVRVDTTRYVCGFIMGWTGIGANGGYGIKPVGVICGVVVVIIAAGPMVG